MSLIRFIVVSVIVTMWFSFANSTNYYVSKSGNDSNSGTSEEQAFLHVAKACTLYALAAGDTVFIDSGVWNETSGGTCNATDGVGGDCGTLKVVKSGAPGNRIVFRSIHGRQRPVLLGQNCSRYAIFNDGQDNITIDSFIVKASIRGIFTDNCDSVIIQNCVVCSTACPKDEFGAENNNAGVFVGYACDMACTDTNYWHSNNIVRGCTLFYNQDRPYGDTVRSNYTFGFNTGGIYSYSCISCLYEDNVVFDQAGGGEGIRMKGGGDSAVVIRRNMIHDCTQGITGYGYDKAEVYENTIYDVSNEALEIHLGNIATRPCDINHTPKFHNNTCVDCGAGMSFVFEDNLGTLRRPEVYDNILKNCRGTPDPSKELTSFNDTTGDSTTNGVFYPYSDFNCLVGLTNVVVCWPYNGLSSTLYTLAQWQSLYHRDLNSINVDPYFVNEAGHNFALSDSSPCIGVGRYGGDMGAVDYDEADVMRVIGDEKFKTSFYTWRFQGEDIEFAVTVPSVQTICYVGSVQRIYYNGTFKKIYY